MLKLWDTPLSDETKGDLIDRVSGKIAQHRLETPAILFLEMHKPLANIAGHAALAFSPFMIPFIGFRTVDEYSQFFADRENIEALIERLEKIRVRPES